MLYFCSKEEQCWKVEYFIFGVKTENDVRREMDGGEFGW